METAHNIRLTVTEVGLLWTTYVNDTMARCVLTYFLNKVEDTEIKPVIEYALKITNIQIKALTALFHSENFPIPIGFTDEDVNASAPRLFTDHLILEYVKNMSKVGLPICSMAFTMTSRSDVRAFYADCISQIQTLDQQSTGVLQSKGLYIRPPFITIPKKVDFVDKQSFLSGRFLGFGDKRPLIAMEISSLSANIMTNALGKALMIGFSQVAKSQEIRQYLVRGKEISSKHIKVFSDQLVDEDIPSPMTWDSDVTNSTVPPFSDKLMLSHVAMLVTAGTGNYAMAAAASPRADITSTFVRLAAEIAIYAKDGAKLTIENGWLEEPPQAPNREELAGV